MFSWVNFLEDHRIRYVTVGPNVARGNVAIKCPFCGDDDPSEHLGLSKTKTFWGCWRNRSHRGSRPHRLIMQLLGCSYEVADGIVGGGRELSRFDELAKAFKRPEGETFVLEGPEVLRMPSDFRRLRNMGSGSHYVNYLVKQRGFSENEITKLQRLYDLQYCLHGFWRGRIIFPIYFEGQLVCWTGRSISQRQQRRYLSLSNKKIEGSDQPLALCNIKNLIWNYDNLVKERHRAVAIAEGPLDALKLDFYGRRLGVRGTCLFGTGVTDQQRLLLADVRKHCEHFLIVPDKGALLNEMDLQAQLNVLSPKILRVPKNVEDPGALNKEQVRKLFKAFA